MSAPKGNEESNHHLKEGRLELVHLLLGTNRNSYVSRPALPDTPDVNLLLRHRIDDLFAGPSHVHHELVRDRRHVLELMLVKEREHVGTHVADDLAALRHEC